MFEIFAGKVRSFKERFFLVKPKSEAALNTLLDAAKNGVRRPLFPLYWNKDHLGFEPRDFSLSRGRLKLTNIFVCFRPS